MKQVNADIRARTVITTHQNADFDAFAAALGAAKLYPEARIVFPGSLNRNVREYAALYGEDLPIVPLRSLEMASVERLIMVDTADCARIGDFGALCGRDDVEVVIFDHHQGEEPVKPPFVRGENWVVSGEGAQSTFMVHILLEREMTISPFEASTFALGIHEDTGSLTYPQTTVRDAEMLAMCLRMGASQALIERYLHNPLTDDQTEVLLRVIDNVRVERIQGQDVHAVALSVSEYVDGLSVIAHKVMELLNCEVLLQAVDMLDRVFVTARSRFGSVDVSEVLHAVGGGGHAQAASGVVKGMEATAVVERLLEELSGLMTAMPTARDIMSRPVRFITADTEVAEALVVSQRYGHSGISVQEEGYVAGIATRRDMDKAVRHGLGHAPVKGIMNRNFVLAREGATVEELRRLMVDANVGRIPVVADDAYERVQREGRARTDDVRGIATKTDVLAAYQEQEARQQGAEVRATGVDACVLRPLADVPFFGRIFHAAAALASDFEGVYLVGGSVRDLLLGQPTMDIDVAVEGDGVEFAVRLARELGGRIREHRKFQTAVVVLPPEILKEAPSWVVKGREPFHIDVATARAEFYDFPAALPSVEHASIRQDLFRRDFTINAMAVSLKPEHFGSVVDFFGGLHDLRAKKLRVLHNLSFIEDPTRIFRAVRYENRYGFRMDEQTRSLARACVDMHLVGDLSSARLRDELVALLSEARVDWTLGRLYELEVARQVHPRLATGPRTVKLIQYMDEAVGRLQVTDEIVRWRLRLAAVTRNMTHDELFLWLEKLRLRHADAEVVRSSVVMAPRLRDQLLDPLLSDWESYELLSRLPVESVVFLHGVSQEARVRERIERFLSDLRPRRLLIDGTDIMSLGLPEGPAVGALLRAVRRLVVEGIVRTRDEQIAAAKDLVAAGSDGMQL
jgi:tRNA nucleotidyltransferase (CCA-adding enzyme)